MRNDGTAAEKAFVDKIEAMPDSHVERLRDAKDLVGLNGGRKVGDFPKPSDFLVVLNGLMHFAEVKSTDKVNRFPFSDIRPYQTRTALLMARIGGPYSFYIYSYGRGAWFVMSAKVYAAAVAEGRRSVTFEELTPWSL